jgi:2-methylisocitrate lyase-like PEP mutase family enzyme
MYPLLKTTYFSEGTGCCIEDKCFPKTNSLLDGRQQPLADIEEFSLKIKVSEILCQLCKA